MQQNQVNQTPLQKNRLLSKPQDDKSKKIKIKKHHKTIKKDLTVKEKSQYAIEIKHLTKQFKKFVAVNDVSFNVNHGKIHGFIGPNGAGKTTTIKCLISAIRLSKGEMLIGGLKSSTVSAKKLVGYIPESARFPKKINTFQYLTSMGQVSQLPRSESKKRSEEILKRVKLWEFRKRNPNAYSSGMKKKVLLNQALLNNPEVLVLDEPAANLDPSARTELFNELKTLRDEGKTVLISSHILSELQNIVDEITILNHGKVVYSGSMTKDNHNLYEIKSSNNQEFKKLLEKHDFKVQAVDKHLQVEAANNADINKIFALALKNDLTILAFNSKETDLQSLYEKVVMDSNNQDKPKEGA